MFADLAYSAEWFQQINRFARISSFDALWFQSVNFQTILFDVESQIAIADPQVTESRQL